MDSSSPVSIPHPTKKGLVFQFAQKLIAKLHSKGEELSGTTGAIQQSIYTHAIEQLNAVLSTPDDAWAFVQVFLLPNYWKKNLHTGAMYLDSEQMEAESVENVKRMVASQPGVGPEDCSPEKMQEATVASRFIYQYFEAMCDVATSD